MGSKRVLRAHARQRETMRYFTDFEFDEDGHTIDPISMGIVAADGRELYIEFAFDEDKVAKNEWVHTNVVPLLKWPKQERLDFDRAKIQIYNFIGTDFKPEFWAYFADYDWVVFCRLWGKMIDLPAHFPKYCMDLQQLFRHLGRPEGIKPAKIGDEHNALADARWNRDFFNDMVPLAVAKSLVL